MDALLKTTIFDRLDMNNLTEDNPMLQSSLCLNKRQEEILQLKTSIINQKKLYCDGNDFYIIHPEIRLIEKLPKGNELVRFFKDNMLKKLGYENLSVASIKSLLNELAVDSEIHIENAVFEKNMEYVNFRNGVLDINTGKFTAEADGYRWCYGDVGHRA